MSQEEEVRYNDEGTRILPGPDGLEELDNPTPRWMTVIYIGTVVWGVGYLMCMPGIGINGLNWSQYKVYERELAAAAPLTPPADVGKLAAAATQDPREVAEGKAAFAQNCAACHGAAGKGAIGPDLTDAAWLYGGGPADIAHTVANGTAKGMPAFKGNLANPVIAELAAYVHSLGNP
ncbi:MAG: cytochrome c oxidase, cbb3-type, subunit [Cyanobacteria bacterium RYN_339]|nr:cytochrome c oxidase, cbb3-type, subunit [Cyanobacteria bacterium RYN_339]